MTLRDDLVDRLETENEMLRERVRQLESMVGISFESPPMFGFTRAESTIFGVLMKNRLASKESLMMAIYRDHQQDEAEIKIVDVWVCKMRRKLTPFGIAVQTQWGQGYFLSAEHKAIARTMLDQANAA